MDDNIGGIERPLPPGVERLGDEDLYMVPFDLLWIAEQNEDDGNYHWHNPRTLGQTENSLGRGFDKQEMQELYADIMDEGLMNPLICRWMLREEKLTVQILDGERRYRCMDRQIEKGEKVWSRKDRSWQPAPQVHAKVPCRIVQGNDKEALKIAFMVSDRAISWGEGATAKLIKKLRMAGCGDEEILELTKKSLQWLREQDRLCQLDDLTFSYFENGKINRALALKLYDIEDLERRHRYLRAAYDDAVATHEEVVTKADEELERAQSKEELVEAELTEAEELGDGEAAETARGKLKQARLRTEAKRRQRADASRPRAKTKNLRTAAAKIAEEEGEELPPPDVVQPLRPGKIREQLETINKLIENGGKDEDSKEILPIPTLRAIVACYKAIVSGEEDIIKVLKRYRAAMILQQAQVAGRRR